MSVLSVWLALFLAASGAAPATPNNLPIISVDVEAPPEMSTREILALIDIQPGYLLNADDIQNSIIRLYSLGRFSAIRVYAEQVQDAIALHFYVRAIQHLGEIEFTGINSAQETTLRRELGFGEDSEVDHRTVSQIKTKTEAILNQFGYPQAEVTVVQTSPPESIDISFRVDVKRHRPLRIASFQFTGTPRLDPILLNSMLSLKPHSVVNRYTLKRDKETLLAAYIQHGFRSVRIAEPLVETDNGHATVIFNIDAGDRIALEFVGNHLVSKTQLLKLWPNANGQLGPHDIDSFRAHVVAHYLNLGYPDAKVEVRGFRDSATGIVRYLFSIDEGAPVYVRHLTFTGVQSLPTDILQEQITAKLHRAADSEGLVQSFTKNELDLLWNSSKVPDKLPKPVPVAERWLPSIYDEALNDIDAAYRDLGFLDTRITLKQSPSATSTEVEIAIEEGTQTFIETITFAENNVVSSGDLLTLIYDATKDKANAAPVYPGAPLSYSGIEDARISMIRELRDQGYLYARVFSDIHLNAERTWATVRYRFEEGPQVHVQRVLVRGNRHTRKGVISSRISTHSGDIYNIEQAMADQRAILALGVFSNVRVKLVNEDQPAEQKDLIVEVSERNRQPVEIAPGISTADGPRLRLSYSHINVFGSAATFTGSLKLNRQIFFQLYGGYADEMRLRYESYKGIEQVTKGVEREARMGIRLPPLLSLPFDPVFRLDIINERDNALNYSLQTGAAILGVDTRLAKHWQSSLESSFSLTDLECPAQTDCSSQVASQRRRSINVGRRWTHTSGPSIAWDKRDNPLSPTSGYYASLKAAYAYGAAQTSSAVDFTPFSFAKSEANFAAYVPIGGPIIAFALRGGTIKPLADTRAIPVDERFFLGGRDTLRGFVEGTLVPQDACILVQGESIPKRCNEPIYVTSKNGVLSPPISQGGNHFLLMKTELRIPLNENLTFDLFLDLGNLWVSFSEMKHLAMRYGTGTGLRYTTPVGALSLDLGINPEARQVRRSEPNWQLHFSVGAF